MPRNLCIPSYTFDLFLILSQTTHTHPEVKTNCGSLNMLAFGQLKFALVLRADTKPSYMPRDVLKGDSSLATYNGGGGSLGLWQR